jgi:hypothetical protein
MQLADKGQALRVVGSRLNIVACLFLVYTPTLLLFAGSVRKAITDECAQYCIRKYFYKIVAVSFLVPIGV